ncbi:MAG: nucleotidyltransferase [Lactobacillaceae bacterium]|jgi:predicted nucleotidyltransferase|nr:nucleotidyltransferase [Lactobacillaceae bacterium]
MTAVGLITEYNPFHNGHAYHLKQAKLVSGADTVVAVMSGNFVQRGVPAIFDKWRRTEFALAGGVDVVYELPFAFAVQPAHIFANGAVQILAAAGVDAIAFGAEHADWDFMALALAAKEAVADADEFHNYNQTFATSFNTVLKAKVGVELTEPNDLLGFSYATAIIELGLADQLQLYAIQREAAQYHDETATDATIASATAVRAMIDTADPKLADYVGANAAKLMAVGAQTKAWATTWFPLLRYKVLTTPNAQLEQLYQLNDGLAYRLYEVLDRLEDTQDAEQAWADFMTAYKSKRYTYARIQRSLLYTILNVTDQEMQVGLANPYLRVLGSSPRGRHFINAHRDSGTLPIVHKVTSADINGLIKLDYRAGRLYQLLAKPTWQNVRQDTGRIPVMKEETKE